MLERFLPLSRRLDLALIIYLSVASFVVAAFFLENYGQDMIYFDAFQNFQTAKSIAQGQSTAHSTAVTQAPFLVYLSLLYRVIRDPANALLTIRIINIFFTVQLVIFFYLIARKMFNHFFSLIGATAALFMPLVMAYSGTLHSDIFALAMGFASLYFSIKPKRLVNLSFATIFLILSSARVDILIVFLLPYLIGLVHYIQSKIHKKFLVLFGVVIAILIVPFYFALHSLSALYASDFFHHSIIEQVVSLVRIDTLTNVLQSSVEMTGETTLLIAGYDGLNKLYLGIFYKILTTAKHQFSDSSTTVIYLAIMAVVSVITLAAFHTEINPKNFSFSLTTYNVLSGILPRYMIAMRLFLLFGFIYGLSLITIASSKIAYLSTKNKKGSSSGEFLTKGQSDLITKSAGGIAVQSTMKTNYKLSTYLSYSIVLFVIALFLVGMWDSAIRYYEYHSVVIKTYQDVTQWLSGHLGNNDRVFLPEVPVFWSFDPTLKNKTYGYSFVWSSIGIRDRYITTDKEILKVRQNLQGFIHNDANHLKYLVFNLNDPFF